MSSKPVPSAFNLLGFTRLSPVSYLYTPPAIPTTLSTSLPISTTHTISSKSPISPPDLILFPSWLDALPKHTAKYLSSYQSRFPTSSIIVVTHTIWEDIKGTRSNKLLWYGPVVAYLQSLPQGANILLHSVSNGGALSIIAIANIYRERAGKPLPIRAQVLDSSPGKPSFWSDINAITLGIPSFPLRLFARLVITLSSFIAKLLFMLIRQQHPLIALRERLVDPQLFNRRAPRVYIYSKEDKMVSWRAVEEHITQARENGFKAEGEEWKGSKHVAHMMMDGERYWGVVERVWRRGFEDKAGLGEGEGDAVKGRRKGLGESHVHSDLVQLQ